MTARISALRGRPFAALIRRPGRKAHLAAVGDGAAAYVTFCDREVLADGAEVTHLARVSDAASAERVCAHCYRMALVAILVESAHAATPRAVVGTRAEWVEWYGHQDGERLYRAAIGETP